MKMKKFVSIILAVALLFTMAVPVYAEAECDIHKDADWNGFCDVCNKNFNDLQPGVTLFNIMLENKVISVCRVTSESVSTPGVVMYLMSFSEYFKCVRYLELLEYAETELYDYYSWEDDNEYGRDYVEVFFRGERVDLKDGNNDLFFAVFEKKQDNIEIENYPELTELREYYQYNDTVFIDGNHEHQDKNYDEKCDICPFAYTAEDMHVHTDPDYDMICDICSMQAFSDEQGVNTTIIINGEYLYLIVCISGVTSFRSLELYFKYDEDFLMPIVGYSNIGFGENGRLRPAENGALYAYFGNPYESVSVPQESPYLFTYAFLIANPDFNAANCPVMSKFDIVNVVTEDGSECKFNYPFIIDSTHTHIDENSDDICDICEVAMFPYHECIDENYDTVCDICGGPVYYWGDMNCDGSITAADARIALRISAQLEEADEYTLFVGDLDGDGRITASEARKILRVAALIDTF